MGFSKKKKQCGIRQQSRSHLPRPVICITIIPYRTDTITFYLSPETEYVLSNQTLFHRLLTEEYQNLSGLWSKPFPSFHVRSGGNQENSKGQPSCMHKPYSLLALYKGAADRCRFLIPALFNATSVPSALPVHSPCSLPLPGFRRSAASAEAGVPDPHP